MMSKLDPKLIEYCNKVRTNSYSPYSKFKVGATIKSSSGQYYSGCNVENSSYGLTLCAEASAICQMIAKGEQLISEIYINSESEKKLSPCGGCRQLIREFSDEHTIIHLGSCTDDHLSMGINDLLPHSFGPDMLNGAK